MLHDCKCSDNHTFPANTVRLTALAQDHQRLHALAIQAVAVTDEFMDITANPDWLEDKAALLAFAQSMRLLREDLRMYEEDALSIAAAHQAPAFKRVEMA